LPLSSKTVLFAWELGEGLGHFPPIKAIARALMREGATVAFAMREMETARTELAEFGEHIVQAPYWPSPAPPAELSGSYADILAGNGYGTARDAQKMIAAWDTVIEAIRPDLIVCEHAPGAALSAFGRLPTAFVGNGFVVPPSEGQTFPPFESGEGVSARQGPYSMHFVKPFGRWDEGHPQVFASLSTEPSAASTRFRRSISIAACGGRRCWDRSRPCRL
jgi:hypothetical protein